MSGNVETHEAAIETTRSYAEEECVGTVGEVIDVEHENPNWVVTFQTHTFAEELEHRVRINRAGNVFSHERDG